MLNLSFSVHRSRDARLIPAFAIAVLLVAAFPPIGRAGLPEGVVAVADAGIAAWEAKWVYQFWRPVTGIRKGSADLNPATAGDPTWYPLGAPATNTTGPNFTPPFPAYPSGHATFGGTLFELLRAYWPDDTAFTLVSDEYNGLNRDADGALRPYLPQTFGSFSEAEYDNAVSRIYNGVHWEFDATSGIELGHDVARFVMEHAFRRISD